MISLRFRDARNSFSAFRIATCALGRFFRKRLNERNASAISGSSRLRDIRAFRIHRGGIFARNLRNARTAEPALDAKSLASLGIKSPHSSRRQPRLNLWKDADPDIPILKEAKAEDAKLQ